ATGDMDGDGYIDVVTGSLGNGTRVHYGDGKGGFPRQLSLSSDRDTASVAVADLNQDGRPDVVEGNSERVNVVHMAQTNGQYQQKPLREDLADDTYHVATGDLNGDGLPDIVESNSGDWNLYYLVRKR
ncbi:MAG: VCBS repeat-containing protein, partial [Lysobacter spongiicola]|nr:VCBS repeat-containing protein [Lysobacter spongiicola]